MSAAPIYLDYNATTPIDPQALESMLPYLRGQFGNPSSGHPYGRAARAAVERARAQVAALIGARPEEVVFTGGGSESNNTVIRGITAGRAGGQIITTAIEHPAVRAPCAALAAVGYRVTTLPVDGCARLDPAALAEALAADTCLVSVMHANNEVGTVEPIAEIAAIARERGVPVHTDAAQSVGKLPVAVGALGVDYLSIAGHKLYAPKGVGALYVRAGCRLEPLILGAGHEAGRRAGTENVAGIVGLGAAAEIAAARLAADAAHCRALRERLWERLAAAAPEVRRNGAPEASLPGTLSVSFRGVDAGALLAAIAPRVAASAGSACHAGEVQISPVLAAMGVPPDWAMGTLRLSLGRMSTAAQIDEAAEAIAAGLRSRGRAGAQRA